MPWTCPKCSAKVADSTDRCPECTGAKLAWTLTPDKTRDFVISRAKFELLRGETEESTRVGQRLAGWHRRHNAASSLRFLLRVV